MRTVLSYLLAYKFRMLLGFLLKISGTLAELVLPLIMAHMIDNVVPTRSIADLTLWGVLMLACAVAALLGNVWANRMASKVAHDTTQRLRADLFAKTLSLSASQTDRATIPSLVSRLSSDTYNVHNMIGMMQRLGVRAPILLIGGVALTFTVDPVLALVLLVSVPFLTLIVIWVSKKGIVLYARLQRSVDTMVRKVRDDYTGIRVIKALSKTRYESDTFKQINQEVVKNETSAGVTTGITSPTMNALLNLGMTAVIFVGAYRVSGGHAMVGDIIAFTSYFTVILNAVISVSRIFVNFSKGGASAKRIQDILCLPEELLTLKEQSLSADSSEACAQTDASYTSAAKASYSQRENAFSVPAFKENLRARGASDGNSEFIRFEDVSFSYNGVPALRHISFCIGKGESLGIIGGTGSGKSTLVALLIRFYDPDEGRIFIEGRDIRAYDRASLREKFGIVFQNDFLMAASIGENIDFERELPFSALSAAAQYAKADSFIAEHGGYNELLTARGSNFSGGQKQRLLIARALAGGPEILILDDSSSALDYKTDAQLRRALPEHFPDTTIIMIAQRISSVRFARHILVLDQGEAVGFGRDEELMRNCGVYRSIYSSQHEKENEGGLYNAGA